MDVNGYATPPAGLVRAAERHQPTLRRRRMAARRARIARRGERGRSVEGLRVRRGRVHRERL